MTLLADPTEWRRTPFGRAFTLMWIAIFAAGVASTLWRGGPLWAWLVGGIGVAAWAIYVLLPSRLPRAQLALEFVLIAAGGLAALPTNLVAAAAMAVGLTLTIRRPERSRRIVVLALAVAVSAGGVGALLAGPWRNGREWLLLGELAVVAIALLLGISRRQAALAAQRARELERERTRSERLDDHARVARELHDVLAHGLGGLVVQLDAVDALLESGRTADAQQRVRAAQGLARAGLADARRAVDALRSPDDEPPVAAVALREQLDELLDAHRGLGGRADARIDPGVDPVPAATATALRRALQEALSNARKHAPGEPVTVRVVRDGGRLRLSVENPIGPAGELAASGGHHGIAGMRERFAQIDGGVVEAGAVDGRFRVRVEAGIA